GIRPEERQAGGLDRPGGHARARPPARWRHRDRLRAGTGNQGRGRSPFARARRRMVTGATTILLAEDHQVLREGVRLLPEPQPDLQVIGEVSDGPGAVAAAARLRPDVLVVDITLPRLSGLEDRKITRLN